MENRPQIWNLHKKLSWKVINLSKKENVIWENLIVSQWLVNGQLTTFKYQGRELERGGKKIEITIEREFLIVLIHIL